MNLVNSKLEEFGVQNFEFDHFQVARLFLVYKHYLETEPAKKGDLSGMLDRLNYQHIIPSLQQFSEIAPEKEYIPTRNLKGYNIDWYKVLLVSIIKM